MPKVTFNASRDAYAVLLDSRALGLIQYALGLLAHRDDPSSEDAHALRENIYEALRDATKDTTL